MLTEDKVLKRYNRGFIVILLLCIWIIPACGKEQTMNLDVPPEVLPPAEPVIEEVEEPYVPAYTAPLTGLGSEEPVDRRPLAVMINNAPAARPQSGLGEADVIYEVLAEGGITRLVAIYQSGDMTKRVGPIRSIRPYLIDLGESHNAVLVHAGASTEAYAILQKQRKEHLDEITNSGPYFWRDKSRKAPHNLYSSVEKLIEGTEKRGFEVKAASVPSYIFRQPEDIVTGDTAASKLEIKFQLDSYRVGYEYDSDSQLYKRFINDKQHLDLDTSEQLTAANLVVMGANHKVLDDVGRLAVNLETGGDAVVFQRGQMIEGQWIRRSDDIIRFVKDNVEIPFYPGKTFIHIVPNEQGFHSKFQVEEVVTFPSE